MPCCICGKPATGHMYAVGVEFPIRYYTCDEHREESRAMAQEQFDESLKALEAERNRMVDHG